MIFKPFFKGKGHQTTPNLQPARLGITIRPAFYPKPAQHGSQLVQPPGPPMHVRHNTLEGHMCQV